MILKVDNEQKLGNDHIAILYPGKLLGDADTGIGTIGRIDQANIAAGATIKMHPHMNDDILSYFRTGKVKHTDSAGFTEFISRNKLMLMKSGEIFYHEEHVMENMEGLQIFIRPQIKDDRPNVTFADLTQPDSNNVWRVLASSDAGSALQLSSETWIYDMTLTSSDVYSLPALPKENLTGILYAFQGELLINEMLKLSKGESVIFKNETVSFRTDTAAELVLFLTDETAPFYAKGMYSGNQNSL